MGVLTRLAHAFNAFTNQEQERTFAHTPSYGGSFSATPHRTRPQFSNERSIITSIYTRISIDVASVLMKHVRLDDQGRYLEDIDSGLNNVLTLEANLDQAGRSFRQDVGMTLCDRGVAALVPVDTTLNPNLTGGYDILTMRVGEITRFDAQHVLVSVYNEEKGRREDLYLPKRTVGIVENPLYAVMNEPNSTLQRLIRKLNLLDSVDEASASGKLDMIIQLPYVIKSETRRQQAEQRRKDIEFQLKGSQYGIAYTDGTEKITQLNRPAENNMMSQVEYLTNMLYGQLGITAKVMDGSASEEEILNYWNRTIEPMVDAIVGEMKRKFLTKTARSQRQSVVYFRDPFKLIPISKIADIADKFTRNEILASNEVRQIVGFKPSQDPKADQLVNSNMPAQDTGLPIVEEEEVDPADEELESLVDGYDGRISQIYRELGVEEEDDDELG